MSNPDAIVYNGRLVGIIYKRYQHIECRGSLWIIWKYKYSTAGKQFSRKRVSPKRFVKKEKVPRNPQTGSLKDIYS